MKTVVISQPMFFPWRGMFEQIALADVYIHYDDVQFSKGSFVNRVQVKTAGGIKWLTVPLKQLHLGQQIGDVLIDDGKNWRQQHLTLLTQALERSSHFSEMIALVKEVYDQSYKTISGLSKKTMDVICNYFNLREGKEFYLSSELDVPGKNYERVLNLVKKFNGSCYVTGHGAKNYMNHQLFEDSGIEIRYMDYNLSPYPQLFDTFTPYVSILDLIANTGKDAINHLQPQTKNWKEFIHG